MPSASLLGGTPFLSSPHLASPRASSSPSPVGEKQAGTRLAFPGEDDPLLPTWSMDPCAQALCPYPLPIPVPIPPAPCRRPPTPHPIVSSGPGLPTVPAGRQSGVGTSGHPGAGPGPAILRGGNCQGWEHMWEWAWVCACVLNLLAPGRCACHARVLPACPCLHAACGAAEGPHIL